VQRRKPGGFKEKLGADLHPSKSALNTSPVTRNRNAKL
jgi:hypothetical protein